MKRWSKIFAIATLLMAVCAPSAFAQKQVVKVGMSGGYFPFTFVRDDKLQGFEVDVWNAIGKQNNYDVKFVTASFSGLFGLLETGRINTISNQITITAQRKAKYLFSNPYVIDGVQITVRKDNKDIHSLKDLNGKTVAVDLGSNFAQILEKYNKEHNGTIKIKTFETGVEQVVAMGRADAYVMDRLSAAQLIKKSNLPLKLAGKPFSKIENAWPFVNNAKGRQLRDQVNKALAQLRKNGTLKKISEKWFDTDITK
ncbi:amino acid ABC transporter substrate-binding protein [Celerinatantimonas sp. MCCC 1A17872]|uniref:amino acid ABC transporter substrate-binding protein n=1 Tax=Celerinatantimonas sp. MCCC 1A17872 TaxID=3177514 RepID=UPI0038CAC9A9